MCNEPDYELLLENYLTSDEWENQVKQFLEFTDHKEAPQGENDYGIFTIHWAYKQKIWSSPSRTPDIVLSDIQIAKYLSVDYSPEQRFAVIFGLWWGLPEEKALLLGGNIEDERRWELLTEFIKRARGSATTKYKLDYQKILEYYLTSEEWCVQKELFFLSYHHRWDPEETKAVIEGYDYNPPPDRKWLISKLYVEYKQRLNADGGTPKLHLTDEQIAKYFARKYSATRRFTIIFGLWWGLPEDEIQQIDTDKQRENGLPLCEAILDKFLWKSIQSLAGGGENHV